MISKINMDDDRKPHRHDRRNTKRNVDALELTEEERKVLRECRFNSMIRGVPAGIIAAGLTSFAVRSGRFPHLTNWSRFYYGVAFTGGLLFGVTSYRNICMEKIMNLENSALADQVREYYRRAGMEYIGPQSQRKTSEFDDAGGIVDSQRENQKDEFSQDNSAHSSRLHDEDKNISMDRQSEKLGEAKSLSFEERRRQHRQQWNMDQYPHPTRSSRKFEETGGHRENP